MHARTCPRILCPGVFSKSQIIGHVTLATSFTVTLATSFTVTLPTSTTVPLATSDAVALPSGFTQDFSRAFGAGKTFAPQARKICPRLWRGENVRAEGAPKKSARRRRAGNFGGLQPGICPKWVRFRAENLPEMARNRAKTGPKTARPWPEPAPNPAAGRFRASVPQPPPPRSHPEVSGSPGSSASCRSKNGLRTYFRGGWRGRTHGFPLVDIIYIALTTGWVRVRVRPSAAPVPKRFGTPFALCDFSAAREGTAPSGQASKPRGASGGTTRH